MGARMRRVKHRCRPTNAAADVFGGLGRLGRLGWMSCKGDAVGPSHVCTAGGVFAYTCLYVCLDKYTHVGMYVGMYVFMYACLM